MITRVPIAAKETLKQVAADSEYGTLRGMFENMLTRFLEEMPHRKKNFEWMMPGRPKAPGWIAYNIVVSDELANQVKEEAALTGISLTTVLFSVIAWYVPQLRNVERQQVVAAETPITKPAKAKRAKCVA